MDALEALRRSMDFAAAGPPTLEQLAGSMSRRTWTAGEVVFKEGDAPGPAYLVQSGRIRLTSRRSDGRQELLADMGPGEMIGEMTALLERARTATATAGLDAIGWEMPAGPLRRAFQQDGALSFSAMLAVMGLMVEQDAEAVLRAGRTPVQELATRILELQRRFGVAEGELVPVGQGDLALMLGSSPGSFSIMFGKFVRAGAIRSAAGGIVVINEEMLRRLAND